MGDWFEFIRDELSEVEGRSRRSWANLIGRTIAALLGCWYVSGLTADVNANMALFELFALGSRALASLFSVVLLIEFAKVVLHLSGKQKRLRKGKEFFAQVMTAETYRKLVDNQIATRSLLDERGIGDQHHIKTLESLAAIGVYAELQETNNKRRFLLAPELWEYLHAKPAERAALRSVLNPGHTSG